MKYTERLYSIEIYREVYRSIEYTVYTYYTYYTLIYPLYSYPIIHHYTLPLYTLPILTYSISPSLSDFEIIPFIVHCTTSVLKQEVSENKSNHHLKRWMDKDQMDGTESA